MVVCRRRKAATGRARKASGVIKVYHQTSSLRTKARAVASAQMDRKLFKRPSHIMSAGKGKYVTISPK